VDPFELGGQGAENAARWLEGTLEHAAARAVPILPAAPWLAFSEARYAAYFDALTWEAAQGRLTFEVTTPASPFDVEVLVPRQAAELALAGVTVDGQAAAWVAGGAERRIGAVSFAAVRVASGRHTLQVQYAP
jgi:hypothetical protein